MTVQIDFRCAFLKYLLDPSNKNKKQLSQACLALCDFVFQQTRENKGQNWGADEGNDAIYELVKEVIKGIGITGKQIAEIQSFVDEISSKNKEKGIRIDTVLTASIGVLTEEKRVVSEGHYAVFAAIYPIELDGHRLQDNTTAGKAALTLSQRLMAITWNVHTKDRLEESDKNDYKDAYIEAKGQGIETHRGFKEKFYNLCRILSCVFIVPIFIYASQDSFWSTVKTKTQEDVEQSKQLIETYQNSFPKH